MANTTLKLPRKGTRRRAVFDRLYKDFILVEETTWQSAKDAYDNHPPAYPLKAVPYNGMPGFRDPREYSGMDVWRCLKKYARRVSRGRYEMKPECVTLADKETDTVKKPFPPIGHVLSETISSGRWEIPVDKRMIPRDCADPKCPICSIFRGSNLKPIAHSPLTSESVEIKCKCGKVRLESLTHELMQFGGYFHSRTKCMEPSNPFANVQAASVPSKIPLISPEETEIKRLQDKIIFLEAEIKVAKNAHDAFMKAADDKVESQRKLIMHLESKIATAIDILK